MTDKTQTTMARTDITEAQFKAMKRIILIAEGREPISAKVVRRTITITDNFKEHLRSAATVTGIICGAMRR